jgi:hypothetical protein
MHKLACEFAHQAVEPLTAATDRNDPMSLEGEATRDRRAEARRRASDQYNHIQAASR